MDRPPSGLLSGRRVLVVEDEMMVLWTIEEMLAELGCECVTAAATIGQSLALIDAQTFDAAMLDLNLDGVKSYPIADALAARQVPFLFATGYSDHGETPGYRGHPLLKKPYLVEDLAEIFEHLFAKEPPAPIG